MRWMFEAILRSLILCTQSKVMSNLLLFAIHYSAADLRLIYLFWCSVPSPKSCQIVAIASVRHLILFRNKPKIVWRTFILSYIILANQEIYIFPKKRWTFVWKVKTNLSPLFPRWSVWWKTGFRVFILIFCLRPIGSQLLLEWKVCAVYWRVQKV